MKEPSKAQINGLLGVAFWCVVVGVYSLNSTQTGEEQPRRDSAFVESKTTQLARENMICFRRMAPRQDLILGSVPWGGRHPNEMTLYLARAWDKTPPATQKRLLKEWSATWVQCTQTSATNGQKPHIWFRPTHREHEPFKG